MTWDATTIAIVATAAGTVVLAFATFFLALYERRGLKLHRNELAHLATQQSATAIFDILVVEYLDRQFKSRSAIRVDDQNIPSVREAKRVARRKYKNRLDDWDVASDVDRDEWENHLAFELGIALERIGIAVFTGVIPVSTFLALASDQVLEDWVLCRAWIFSYRKTPAVLDATGVAPFHRRHAEWLVLLSALWMQRHFPTYRALAPVVEQYATKLERTFIGYTLAEIDLMPQHVRKTISRLTGAAV